MIFRVAPVRRKSKIEKRNEHVFWACAICNVHIHVCDQTHVGFALLNYANSFMNNQVQCTGPLCPFQGPSWNIKQYYICQSMSLCCSFLEWIHFWQLHGSVWKFNYHAQGACKCLVIACRNHQMYARDWELCEVCALYSQLEGVDNSSVWARPTFGESKPCLQKVASMAWTWFQLGIQKARLLLLRTCAPFGK